MAAYYRVQIITDPPRYQAEEWPPLAESMLPRIGEQIRAKNGFTMTVAAITHAEEGDTRDHKTRVVEILLRKACHYCHKSGSVVVNSLWVCASHAESARDETHE